jgi:hypothetical protein
MYIGYQDSAALMKMQITTKNFYSWLVQLEDVANHVTQSTIQTIITSAKIVYKLQKSTNMTIYNSLSFNEKMHHINNCTFNTVELNTMPNTVELNTMPNK